MSTEDSVAEHVRCPLCFGHYEDPRMLPCLHSFCRHCLQKMIDVTDTKQTIECPTCQRAIDVPEWDAGLLPQNLHLAFEVEVAGYMSKMADQTEVLCTFCTKGCNNSAVAFCCTCCKFLCSAGDDSHKRVPQLFRHSIVEMDHKSSKLLPSLIKPNLYFCSVPNHSKEELKFFCEECKHLICRDCILVLHKDHKVIELSMIANGHRDRMKVALDGAHTAVSKLTDFTDANAKMMMDLYSSKQRVEMNINQAFEQLHRAIDERRKALFSDLEAVLISKTIPLSNQDQLYKQMLEDIGRYTKAILCTLQTHTDHEVVALGSLLPNELQAILKGIKQLPIIPIEHCNIGVSVPTGGLESDLSNFGCVTDDSPSFAHSTWTSDGIARSNKVYRITVCTRTSKGDEYKFGGLQVEAELQPMPDGYVVLGHVEDHSNGTYTVTITPCTAGPHELHITMNHMHINQSPCELVIRTKRDYHTLCNARQLVRISGPYAIAIHHSGDLYVANNSHCICVFDQSGHLKNTIGNLGTGNAKFQYPYGITIKADILYVADYGNHCIQKLTTCGEFIHKFGEKGAGPGQMNGPMALVVDSKHNLVVSERHNHRIQIFSPTGTSLMIIDGSTPGNGMFQAPWGVALDHLENIHILTCSSNNIKVFTPDGRFVRTYGNVKGPIGIAIDDQGYTLVSEGSGNSVTIFDPRGEKIHTIMGFRWPWGVCLDLKGDGCIYIANNGTNTVLKYSL